MFYVYLFRTLYARLFERSKCKVLLNAPRVQERRRDESMENVRKGPNCRGVDWRRSIACDCMVSVYNQENLSTVSTPGMHTYTYSRIYIYIYIGLCTITSILYYKYISIHIWTLRHTYMYTHIHEYRHVYAYTCRPTYTETYKHA